MSSSYIVRCLLYRLVFASSVHSVYYSAVSHTTVSIVFLPYAGVVLSDGMVKRRTLSLIIPLSSSIESFVDAFVGE